MISKKRTVIFLTRQSPYPIRNLDNSRKAQYIKLLSESLEVEIICFESMHTESEVPSHTKIEMIENDRTSFLKRIMDPLRPAIFSPYSSHLANKLKEKSGPGKLLWISDPAFAGFAPMARKLDYRVIIDESHTGRFCKTAHALVTGTQLGASRLRKSMPEIPVHVIPYGIDAKLYAWIREQQGHTLFSPVVMDSKAHLEGMIWFISEVLPRLRAALGKNLPPIVIAGPGECPEYYRNKFEAAGIRVESGSTSLFLFLSNALVVFYPIKSELSRRFEILEAMAAGRPIVSTAKGVEGLMIAPGYDLWVADQADGFTSGIVHLLGSPKHRAELKAHALKTVESHYDLPSSIPLFEALLRSLS